MPQANNDGGQFSKDSEKRREFHLFLGYYSGKSGYSAEAPCQ